MKKFKRKVLAMLMTNNFGSSLRQQLFDGAPFCSELLYTAIPQRAASGTTATFTRATTSTWPNNDGYMVTGVAGEIGFPGARRVRNLQATSSEPTSGWTAAGATPPTVTYTTLDGSGAVSMAFPVVAAGYANSRCSGPVNSVSWVQNSTKIATQMVVSLSRALTGSEALTLYLAGASALDDVIVFNASNSPTSAVLQSVVDTFVNPTFSGTMGITVYVSGAIVGSPVTLSLTRIQFEDVTAQTTQTAGEYVSVGATSGNNYGTELVSNGTFDTATTSWTASNLNGSVATLSSVGGRLRITNNAAGGRGAALQTITLVSGKSYTFTCQSWTGTSAVTSAQVRLGTTPAAFDIGLASSTADGQTLSFNFTASGTTAYLTLDEVFGDASEYIEFDDVSIKENLFHGSMVDGVKCFPTDLAGNALTTMLGYLAEGARTNLCLQSQTFDNASWAKAAGGGASVPVVTANQAIAPDGTTTADKVVFVAPTSGDISTLSQSPVLPAGTYAGAIYVKAFAAGDVGKILGFRHAGSSAYTLVTLTSVWQRVSSTEVRAGNNIDITLRPSEGTSSGTVSVYLWGAQVELGASASSYIATTTIAVARNADVLTYSSAGNIDGTVGWAYCETNLGFIDAATNNWMITRDNDKGLLYSNGTDGQIVVFDGVQGAVKSGLSTLVGTYTNCASTWGGGSQSVTANGAAPATAAFDGDMSPTTTIDIGANSTGNLWGTIRNVRIGQRQLSASELQAITS